MNVKIEKMDDFGRGIAYIDDKVVFVPKTIVDDIVDIKITNHQFFPLFLIFLRLFLFKLIKSSKKPMNA